MAFFANLGTVTVTQNPATQGNVPRPNTTQEVYSTFAESISGEGLVHRIFEGSPRVISSNDPASAFIKWPDKYGTNSPPWGSPNDPITGYREERLEGEDWDSVIEATATSRSRLLAEQADLAVMIAKAVDAALDAAHHYGTTTVNSGFSSWAVGGLPFSVNDGSLPICAWKYDGTGGNYPRIVGVSATGNNTFTVHFAEATNQAHVLHWQAFARGI